jgi:hypothetical protein
MPFYFRIPLPSPFGYSYRIGGRRRKRRPARQQPPPPRYKQLSMHAKDLRRMSPTDLAYAIADSDLSSDQRHWVREAYGDVPAGRGWRWSEDDRLVVDQDSPGRPDSPVTGQLRQSYTASFGDWTCSHSHATEREARRCGAERRLWEYEQLEQQLMAIDMSEADQEAQRKFIKRAQDIAARKRAARAELEALS